MKKILNHLRSDWYKYLLELIVITAGVLGAFALNNWNEDNKDETASYNALVNVLEDLKQDSIQFQYHYKNSYRLQNYLDRTIHNLLNNGSNDSLEFYYQRSRGYLVAVVHNSAFQSMNELGLVSEISNEELKTDLMRYFNFVQPNVVEFREFEFNRLESSMKKIVTDEAINLEATTVDDLQLDYAVVRKILLQPSNINRLYQYRDTQQFLAKQAKQYINANNDLMIQLNAYLGDH